MCKSNKTPKPVEDLYREELALEEMRRAYDEYSNASDVLDQKSSTLLNSASLIVSLFSLLQFSFLKPGQSPLYWAGIVLVFGLYVGMIVLSTNSMTPKSYRGPIAVDWEEIGQSILVQSPKDALLKMLSNYVEQIPHNAHLNNAKAARVKTAGWFLAAIVVLLLLLSLFPR